MVHKTKLKPLSPLQAMTQHSQIDDASIPELKIHNVDFPSVKAHSDNLVLLVDPGQIRNWEYHDRPSSELGNIDEFAIELKSHGQLQPCIVRPLINNSEYKFELIVGERRWRAAKKANIQLKVLIKELNDHDAAIAQANENSQRKDLSEFAKGMSYAKLINDKVLNQADLTDTLKVSQAEVSRLLSFSKIPQIIWDAIEDKSKISARTAAEMRSLCNKGERYIEAIIRLAKEIESGKLGEKLLKRRVEQLLSDSKTDINAFKEVKTSNGRHIFTWRKDSNNNFSISFPKDIREIINQKQIEETLRQDIEMQLDNLKETSDTDNKFIPRGINFRE